MLSIIGPNESSTRNVRSDESRHENFRRVLRRLLGAGASALAFCAFSFGAGQASFAQSSGVQLEVDKSTTMSSLDESINSVVFNGAYTLTLLDGQVLRPVFLSRKEGAALVLGAAPSSSGSSESGEGEEKVPQTWSLTSNSPSWSGTIAVMDGNSLVLDSVAANPLGSYSEANTGVYSTTILSNGATLTLPQRLLVSGKTQEIETKIGRLETAHTANEETSEAFEFANVDIGAGRTLTVENGFVNDDYSGLTKRGAGTLNIVANGSSVGTTTGTTNYVPIYLGDVYVAQGTLRVSDGTALVDDVDMMVDTIVLGEGSSLDIQSYDTIELGGMSGDVVFSAGDNSNVMLYVGEEGYTNFVATTYNTYISLGKTNLTIDSELLGTEAPDSLVVFSTEDVGQTVYNASDISIVDNILGKNYVVDLDSSSASSLVLKLVDSVKFADVAESDNEKSIARSFDKLIESGKYTPAEYAELSRIEDNLLFVDLDNLSGEIYATQVGFHYMNNLMTQQALFSHFRNNALVSYSDAAASVAPQDYDSGRINTQQRQGYPITGGAANGSFDGPLYYNTNTNSYAPGVVPTQQVPPQYTNGVYNGEYLGGYGDVNSYGFVPRQYSTLTTMRGQEAQYGDPGTLIYSAWVEVLGGAMTAREHKSALGYDGKQLGGLVGLDLFGSCDCRFGVYYGYQENKIESLTMLGMTRSAEHQVGLYHQFGDENVYSIGTIHGGYDRYKTNRFSYLLDEYRELWAKNNTWSAGATFERGMNFKANPFTFSPYLQADYNFFLRQKFAEKGDKEAWPYALIVKKSNYHSLRGSVGARLSVDLYPGEQQIRLFVNGAYVHEFFDGIYGETHMNFAGFPSSSGFEVYGNSLGRDWGIVGVGGEWAPIPALDLFAKGDYIVNKYVRNPGGSAGVKYRW